MNAVPPKTKPMLDNETCAKIMAEVSDLLQKHLGAEPYLVNLDVILEKEQFEELAKMSPEVYTAKFFFDEELQVWVRAIDWNVDEPKQRWLTIMDRYNGI